MDYFTYLYINGIYIRVSYSLFRILTIDPNKPTHPGRYFTPSCQSEVFFFPRKKKVCDFDSVDSESFKSLVHYLKDHPMTCKWLITMVSFRPLSRVIPLPNGLNGL